MQPDTESTDSKSNTIDSRNEDMFTQGSAPPPTYSSISAYFPQPSSYENFSTYTVMGKHNQLTTNVQSPVIFYTCLLL